MLKRFAAYWPFIPIGGLVLIFFYKLAFTDFILARGDTYAYFYPYWTARNEAFMRGDIPLWSPHLFMGVPLMANSQIGMFYPPNWPLSPFDAPNAIRISLLAHVMWTMLGVYALARRAAALDKWPALTAALIFGLSGYLGTRVEQINQLQGISWMPWLFLLFHLSLEKPTRYSPLLTMALALQFLSGHTQTVFITLIGLGIYALVAWVYPNIAVGAQGLAPLPKRIFIILRPFIILALTGLAAIILASPQLIPTFELMNVSNRRGGLNPNQATAFSLNPVVIGRGLLPSYDGLLFGEYVAYPGVIGLGLAVVGLLLSPVGEGLRPSPAKNVSPRLIWAAVMIAGILLALGEFNPVYWWLAGLPGFNLFRVPARWLGLFALGAAMLSGLGLQALLNTPRRPSFRVLAAVILVVAVLVFGSTLARLVPAEVTGSAMPTAMTFAGWGVALISLFAGFWFAGAQRVLPLLIAIELFLSSQILSFNDLVPPEIYSSPRFTVSQLRAYESDQTPPDRLLSITQLYFDPGDKAALEARYAAFRMGNMAVFHALDGIKKQETLAANLPLLWEIPSIDGFDGGLLPTSYYTAFTSLMIPPSQLRTIDGRLREVLGRPECRGACIPDQRWLNLTNTRYLITDKIFDLWYEDIAYDTQFEITLEPGAVSTLSDFPEFQGMAVDVLYMVDDENCGDASPCAPIITLLLDDDTSESPQPPPETQTVDTLQLARFAMSEPATPAQIDLSSEYPTSIRALTLVDTRTGDFQQVTFNPWQRVLSSDIKLYQNQQVMPRAFVVYDAMIVMDDEYGTEDALNLMRDPAFDPTQTVILSSDEPVGTRHALSLQTPVATITAYQPERLEITAQSERDAFLVLTDSYYPGWQVTVNGQPAHLYRADVMFRAVAIPAGESTIVFEFKPVYWPWSLIIGGAAWILALLMVIALNRRSQAAA